jgi:hypothetical protein
MVKTILLLFLIAMPDIEQTRTKEKDLYTSFWQKKLSKQWKMIKIIFVDCIVEADAEKLSTVLDFLEESQRKTLVRRAYFFPLSNTQLKKTNPLEALVRMHGKNIKKQKECTYILKELVRYGASWDGLEKSDLIIINQWMDRETLDLIYSDHSKTLFF